MPVAIGEELKEAEHHLATARAIREDGHDAHNVGYWEKEVARRRAKVAALSACDQCGASRRDHRHGRGRLLFVRRGGDGHDDDPQQLSRDASG